MTKAAGAAFVTVVGTSLLFKKLTPSASDLIEAAVHFRNGMTEFQKGIAAAVFGADSQKKTAAEKRESSRIPIE